jgi:protein TonB
VNPAIDFPLPASHRLPAWALGLSLAVHLALLVGPVMERQSVTELPPLRVSFRLPVMLAPVAAERPPVEPRIVPAKPVVAAQSPVRERQTVTAPVPAVLAVARPANATDSALLVAPSAVASTTPAAERSEAAPVAHPVPATESADAAAMARYIRLLGDLLAEQQQYPRLAAARGWEGEVRLRLQVARKGTIIAVHIVHSSGFDVLDQHAMQLVHGTTLPPPPAAQSSSGSNPDFTIDIPIHYALKRS